MGTGSTGYLTLMTMRKLILTAAVAAVLVVSPLAPTVSFSACNGYINVDDNCVRSPDHTPGNYNDGDGTNSHSEHKQGSGSWHGGTGRHRS